MRGKLGKPGLSTKDLSFSCIYNNAGMPSRDVVFEKKRWEESFTKADKR